MGLSINISQNELITVSDIGSAFMIESRRYGHGVGMSQRGAQQMAAQYGMTYEEILGFYYPGMGLLQYDLPRSELPAVNLGLMGHAGADPQPDSAAHAHACDRGKPAGGRVRRRRGEH